MEQPRPDSRQSRKLQALQMPAENDDRAAVATPSASAESVLLSPTVLSAVKRGKRLTSDLLRAHQRMASLAQLASLDAQQADFRCALQLQEAQHRGRLVALAQELHRFLYSSAPCAVELLAMAEAAARRVLSADEDHARALLHRTSQTLAQMCVWNAGGRTSPARLLELQLLEQEQSSRYTLSLEELENRAVLDDLFQDELTDHVLCVRELHARETSSVAAWLHWWQSGMPAGTIAQSKVNPVVWSALEARRRALLASEGYERAVQTQATELKLRKAMEEKFFQDTELLLSRQAQRLPLTLPPGMVTRPGL
eukprot:RCo022285